MVRNFHRVIRSYKEEITQVFCNQSVLNLNKVTNFELVQTTGLYTSGQKTPNANKEYLIGIMIFPGSKE